MGEYPTWKNPVIRFKLLKPVPSKHSGHLENLPRYMTVSASPRSILQALANKKIPQKNLHSYLWKTLNC